MNKPDLLQRAALLRDEAARALRLADGLQDKDKKRLLQFGEQLREEAAELERQAKAIPPAEPSKIHRVE